MLYLNDVLEHKGSGVKLRVIHVDYAVGDVWLYDLGNDLAFPKLYSLQEVGAMLDDDVLSQFQGVQRSPVISPSKAAIRKRDEAYQRIKPLTTPPDILIPEERSALVQSRAAELGCSPQTLYKDLRNWWRNGLTANALLPLFHNCGSTGGTTANRGRPPKYLKRSIFQIEEADRTILITVLETLYLKNDVMTLRGCYQRMLEKHYTYLDGEGRRHLKAEGEYPSEQQFRYFAKKTLPAETVIRQRKGDSVFELEHRAKTGSLQHQTYTAGDAYEIDATIADVFLVSRRNRATIIGKPTLYLIFDRKSWLIVGFYVGLESPCWPAAMQAIKSISEDKAALCQRHGVPYDPADWTAHGVFPKEFIADRGSDVLSDNSTLLVDGLEIGVRNLPARRADHKPLVECGFKLLQRSMADALPGYAPPEYFGKRQGKHYEMDASLNLDEFTNIIFKAIIKFNRTPREKYIWPAEHVLNGLQPIPLYIWNIEIRRRAGALVRLPEERVRFSLLPKARATVTREGIRLGACYYSCQEAISRGWMVAAGRGAFTVNVSYDRRLVDSIYIHDDKDSTKYFVATLLDRCSDYRGLSFQEVEGIEYYRQVLRHEGRQIARQNQLEFHEQVDPLTQQARAEMKQMASGKSRSSRKEDIVKAREDERREQRQVEARIFDDTSSSLEPAPVIKLEPSTQETSEIAQTQLSERDARRRKKYLEMLNGN